MRERLEDLGRILVISDKVLDSELFEEWRWPGRPKDTDIWLAQWTKKTEDERYDWFYDMCCWMLQAKEDLIQINSIAKGFDDLNEGFNYGS